MTRSILVGSSRKLKITHVSAVLETSIMSLMYAPVLLNTSVVHVSPAAMHLVECFAARQRANSQQRAVQQETKRCAEQKNRIRAVFVSRPSRVGFLHVRKGARRRTAVQLAGGERRVSKLTFLPHSLAAYLAVLEL